MGTRTGICAAVGLWVGLMAVSGCASTPAPTELLNARRAYQEAASSPAATMAPAELLAARQAVDRAEAAFADEPDSQRTRDLAYVAERRSQRAEVVGGLLYSQGQTARARRDFMALSGQVQQRTEGQLAAVNQERAIDRERLAAAQGQVAAAQGQAQAEREARIKAEAQAREAVQSLDRIAAIRVDQARGTIITLSGSVLFASAQSTLLANARERLDQVAEALKKQGTEQSIVVEGYTDSRGSDQTNDELSLRRAQAVREYLVSRGVPAERIRAVGRGKANPIADNASPEGRANNRRVEIVIEPAAVGLTTPKDDAPGADPYESRDLDSSRGGAQQGDRLRGEATHEKSP